MAGQVPDTISSPMSDNNSTKAKKIQQTVKLLKFLLTLDDIEIIKSTLESIIELLEENNNEDE